MFCPKCGVENPDKGRYCRKCGTELGTVSDVLAGRFTVDDSPQLKGRGGKRLSWEGAMLRLFLGVAILVAAFIMGFDYVTGFPNWWLLFLLIAFPIMGLGIAQIIRLSMPNQGVTLSPTGTEKELSAKEMESLPESSTDYVSPEQESGYRTGDLVPSSVTDNTTRHLEMDPEGETRNLPEMEEQ